MEFGRGLCQADFDLDGSFVSEHRCNPEVTGDLVGLDRYGALVVEGSEVVRLDDLGAELGRTEGTDALVAPDGRVLVVDIDPSGAEVSFHLAGPTLGEVAQLEWAPENAGGEYGFVAWSPRATEPQLAFLVALGEGRFQLQRWDLDGTLLNSLNLGGRMWDVTWDRSGRYLLVSGATGGDHLVWVYDLFSLEIETILFSDWVQDAHMINPAECEEASSLTITWQNRLPEGVAVDDLWMVLSRDSGLVSWRFL